MSKILIQNGTIVNEGRSFKGGLIVDGEFISEIFEAEAPRGTYDEVVDASGCFVLPGVIDDHVHFREPGLTRKADIESESRAAAYGGVTSYLEMPNTNPQTTTLEALAEKRKLGAEKSHVNYSFFYGATNDNGDSFAQLDVHRVPGIKLFMGSSTGNMLVDKYESLQRVFGLAKKLGLPVMTHCEDTDTINRNMAAAKAQYGEDPAVCHHPEIRSEEACYESSTLAVKLAKESGARLHIAHLTTAKELELLEPARFGEAASDGVSKENVSLESSLKQNASSGETSKQNISLGVSSKGKVSLEDLSKGNDSLGDSSKGNVCLEDSTKAKVAADGVSCDAQITGEAVIAHLFFSDADYATKGALIKCNPAVKTAHDRAALRAALSDGRISVVGTDHAPHELSDKQGGCAKAASGMPMVQFSLVTMLELVDEGVLSIERMVELMAHNPALLFQIDQRGFLRKGYKADITIVRPHTPWTVSKENIQSKCKWSPMEGHEYQWRVEQTICNGHIIYNKGKFDAEYRGEELSFRTIKN